MDNQARTAHIPSFSRIWSDPVQEIGKENIQFSTESISSDRPEI